MKKFKFVPPYKTINGVTAFPQARERSGVYIIKENNVIVYVGYSGTDLYKTMYRHFQAWNDKKAERVTYIDKMKKNTYTVRLVYCTPLQAARLEKLLITQYEPRDNLNALQAFKITNYDIDLYDTYTEAPVERDAPF